MLIIDALIVILCILIGVRKGGIAVAFAGAFGLAILTFICGLRPTSPPIAVMLIILAVTSLAGTLQCSGGLDLLVKWAEILLRKNPNHITFLAPIVCFLFVTFTGTAFIAMALLPVISEVAREAGVRPERPLSVSCVASSHAIVASPLSAATAAIVGVLATHNVTLGQIFAVLFPSVLIGIILGALSVYKRGAELENDPEFQRRVKTGEIAVASKSSKEYVPTKEAKIAVALFGLSVLGILILGSFKELMPSWVVNGKTVTMTVAHVIEILAMGAACLIMFICKVKPAAVAKSGVFNSGVVGVMVCFGVAWMADTFFAAHKAEMVANFGAIVQAYPWLFGIALFAMAAILMSQGGTIAAMMPVGITLGIAPEYLVALAPAACAVWFFPIQPNLITSVALDTTGSTSLGTYLFNHSSMRPGLVICISSICVAFALAKVVF